MKKFIYVLLSLGMGITTGHILGLAQFHNHTSKDLTIQLSRAYWTRTRTPEQERIQHYDTRGPIVTVPAAKNGVAGTASVSAGGTRKDAQSLVAPIKIAATLEPIEMYSVDEKDLILVRTNPQYIKKMTRNRQAEGSEKWKLVETGYPLDVSIEPIRLFEVNGKLIAIVENVI